VCHQHSDVFVTRVSPLLQAVYNMKGLDQGPTLEGFQTARQCASTVCIDSFERTVGDHSGKPIVKSATVQHHKTTWERHLIDRIKSCGQIKQRQ